MAEKQWKITGYDGLNKKFERSFPHKSFSEQEIRVLLKCLASCHLVPREVISSFLPEDDEWHAGHHLSIQHTNSVKKPGFMTVGSSEHYTATIEGGE